MIPLVYNPEWDRWRLWKEAQTRLLQAAKDWKLPAPVFYSQCRPNSRRYLSGGTLYGEYMTPNRIWVNVDLATPPSKPQPFRVKRIWVWSYPGYKVDRTVSGIAAHEFGHHCWYRSAACRNRSKWQSIVEHSKPVSGYEPTIGEAFAESMRIYIFNPDLLHKARPSRYDFIAQFFPPLHNMQWQDVLINAPDFIKRAAERF